MTNILSLHNDLKNKAYKHSSYEYFKITDPKPRDIHKASVRDRLLHYAIYRTLYPYFDNKFSWDSYSCRFEKGSHKAINRFRSFAYIESRNHTRTIWILKCDIKKFFASIDHSILLQILERYIGDKEIIWLMERIITSFETTPGKGLPLGNLTSQLLVNIYMNEFDQFVKHKLKIKYYIRYADDFVILSYNKSLLLDNIRYIVCYLSDKLKLTLHPDKVFIKTLSSGVDFLGWVHFPDHRVIRMITKRRAIKGIRAGRSNNSLQSYIGLLRHGNSNKLFKRIRDNNLSTTSL